MNNGVQNPRPSGAHYLQTLQMEANRRRYPDLSSVASDGSSIHGVSGMTPRYHGTTQKLNVLLQICKKVTKLHKTLKGKDIDAVCRHEIDDLAAMSQMVMHEVEHREKPYIKYSDRMSDEEYRDWQDQLEKEGE